MLALALAAPSSEVAPARAGAPAGPQVRQLTGAWQLRLGHRGRWHRAHVPRVFDPLPRPSSFRGAVGRYRLSFVAPPVVHGFDWEVRFAGVRGRAKVWLNGRSLGTRGDQYSPFALPARGLRPGHRNRLEVQVDNRRPDPRLRGWWNWGGLSEPVALAPVGRVRLSDLALLPRVECGSEGCRAALDILGTLRNRDRTARAAGLRLDLRAPDGSTTHYALALPTLGVGQRRAAHASLPLGGTPELWSPDSPRLYEARLELRAGERTQQVERHAIGFKSVTVRGGLLYLNGRRVQLRGAGIQEDVRGRGPALRPADIARIVARLRALHANVTRSHYLLDDRLLSALDRAGIMVWNEAPVWHRYYDLESGRGRQAALTALAGTVKGARDHPSVIADSVGNELSPHPDRDRGVRRYLAAAVRVAHRLNPTVPTAVAFSAAPGYGFQRAYGAYDLLGINSYFGWYRGKAGHRVRKMSRLEPFLEATRRRYPGQGLLLTEFGAEGSRGGPVDRRGSLRFQADFARRNLDVVDQTPFLGAAIYWTLAEFAVEPGWDGGAGLTSRDRDSLHHKGLITYRGRRKPVWRVVRDRFRATQLYAGD